MKQFFLLIFFLVTFCGSFAQQTSRVDFTHLQAELTIQPLEKKVQGNIFLRFDIKKETDSIFIDAQNMDFENVMLNGEVTNMHNDGNRLWVISGFKRSKDNELKFNYSVRPEQAMYFIRTKAAGRGEDFQVWTQGQGKFTSHWLPSFDDTNEKLEFDLTVNYPTGAEVVANGTLQEKSALNDSIVRWEFNMKQPMSSYLVAMAAGDFDHLEKTSSKGTPLLMYYPAGKDNMAEPTYRYTREIFDFLEEEIGMKYPWNNYKQVPVRDFLYAGMENTGTTIFSDLFLVDSIGFNDRNYVNVNAHELAHQWFGNLVTAESDEHHWLQEGFSTYFALLVERELFGEDYYYWKLYESAEELKEMSDSGKGESLLDPHASSLTFYQKGAWALHVLKERIGEEAFKEGIKNFLEKHKYGNANTSDLLFEMEKASGENLLDYEQQWLKNAAFQGSQALQSLRRSDFIKEYLEIASLRNLPLEKKHRLLDRALNFPVNDFIGQEVVNQLSLEDPQEAVELYSKAFETGNLYLRQAIAFNLKKIPEELRLRYESLLEDDSYLTMEAALFNLWLNFPQERASYLEKLSATEGFIDKNLRILWLALNLATPEYEAQDKTERFRELSGYTSPDYRFQVRQNAFGYLFQLSSFTDDNLKDLVEASGHHVNAFRDFSRNLLKELILNKEYRERLESLHEQLGEKEQKYLGQQLAEIVTNPSN